MSVDLGPIYIKINSHCLRDKLANLAEQDQIHRINIFQELILKRYVDEYSHPSFDRLV